MGSLGAPELLIVAVLAGLLFATVHGAYRARKAGDTGWGVGILLSVPASAGWLRSSTSSPWTGAGVQLYPSPWCRSDNRRGIGAGVGR